jgi:hypothetical protein
VRYVDDDITRPSDTSRSGDPWTPGRVLALPGRAVRGLAGMLSSRGIVLITLLWFATSMAAWGIKSQTLQLLMAGYSVPEATGNAVVSAMLVLGTVLMLGGGYLVDRTSPGLVLAAGYVTFIGFTAALASGVLPVVLAVGITLLLAATIDYSRPARAALADRLSDSDNLGKNFGLVTIGISGGSGRPAVIDGRGVEEPEADRHDHWQHRRAQCHVDSHLRPVTPDDDDRRLVSEPLFLQLRQ